MASGSANEPKVRVCFLVNGLADTHVLLAVLHGADDPVGALFATLKATREKWLVLDKERSRDVTALGVFRTF
jgi:hypothetical protein